MFRQKIVSTIFMLASTIVLIFGMAYVKEREKLLTPASIVLAGAIIGFAISNRGPTEK